MHLVDIGSTKQFL